MFQQESSRRARRMERHHRMRKAPALNLVSLMDIFTILVFFLLVSSSAAQQLPNNKNLKLPTSSAKKSPNETLLITITKQDILVQGRKVADVATLLSSENNIIESLKQELLFQSSKGLLLNEQQKGAAKAATIIGDENIPYDLLRRILATCRQASYTQIAFAAMQKVKS